MAKSNQIGYYVPECLTMHKATLMIIQKNIHRIIIQSYSQFVVYSINEKTCVP